MQNYKKMSWPTVLSTDQFQKNCELIELRLVQVSLRNDEYVAHVLIKHSRREAVSVILSRTLILV